jgi:hypothetical protein
MPETASGGQWYVLDANDGVVATGVVPEGGGNVTANFVIMPGETGFTWIYRPLVVGTGETPTLGNVVELNPADVTGSLPSPGAMPTPAPVTPVSPAPIAPTNATVTNPVVLPPVNPDDTNSLINIDVGSVDLGSYDDGETNVLAKVSQLQGLMQGVVADMATVQSNFVSAADKMNGLRLGGVGRQCVFQFGPASIELQSSAGVRTGLTLLVIGLAGFAAAGMIRNAVQ